MIEMSTLAREWGNGMMIQAQLLTFLTTILLTHKSDIFSMNNFYFLISYVTSLASAGGVTKIHCPERSEQFAAIT
jgi:hypothetical protein